MIGYVYTHEDKQFDPNGIVAVSDPQAHNRGLEQSELAFLATKPDRALAYIVKCGDQERVTTWLGTEIGRILNSSRFTNNLTGARMRHVRIALNNGVTYHGTYSSDWSEAVRLRKVK